MSCINRNAKELFSERKTPQREQVELESEQSKTPLISYKLPDHDTGTLINSQNINKIQDSSFEQRVKSKFSAIISGNFQLKSLLSQLKTHQNIDCDLSPELLQNFSLKQLKKLQQILKRDIEEYQEESETKDYPSSEHQQLLYESLLSIFSYQRNNKYIPNQQIGTYTIDPKTNEMKFAYGTIYQNLLQQLQAARQELKNIQMQLNKLKVIVLRKKQVKSLSLQKTLLERNVHFQKLQISDLIVKLKEQKKICEYERMKCKLFHRQSIGYFSKNKWSMFLKRYLPLELIGSGGFGEVYRVFDFEEATEVAMKLNIVEKYGDDDEEQEGFQNKVKHIYREIATHKQLDHERIVKYYDTYEIEEQHDVIIISTMEICEGQDLNEYIKRNYFFEQRECKDIIKQILEALNYLNNLQRRVIHYDLKPHNILYHQGKIKIIDFGLCKVMDQNKEQIELTSVGTGTMFYLPPETFDTLVVRPNGQSYHNSKKKLISTSIDMWAVGVIFYELLYGVRPYAHGMSQQQIYTSGYMKNQLSIKFPPRNQDIEVSSEIQNFILACFKPQRQRITPKEGLQHPCIAGVGTSLRNLRSKINKEKDQNEGEQKDENGGKRSSKERKTPSSKMKNN